MGQPLRVGVCRHGFTLLEIVLALGLTTFMVLSVFYVITGALRSFQRAEEITLARSIAREQIERIKEQKVPIAAGLFDGAVPTAQIDGFPPTPYPMSADGYLVLVRSKALDLRLFSIVVEVYQGKERLTSLETVIKK